MGHDFENGSEFLSALDVAKTVTEAAKGVGLKIAGVWNAFSSLNDRWQPPTPDESRTGSAEKCGRPAEDLEPSSKSIKRAQQ